jgi:hypothetical protein
MLLHEMHGRLGVDFQHIRSLPPAFRLLPVLCTAAGDRLGERVVLRHDLPV